MSFSCILKVEHSSTYLYHLKNFLSSKCFPPLMENVSFLSWTENFINGLARWFWVWVVLLFKFSYCSLYFLCPLSPPVNSVSSFESWWKWWSQIFTLWPTTWSRSGCIRHQRSSWSKGSTARCWKPLRGCIGPHGSPSSRGSTSIALFSPGPS